MKILLPVLLAALPLLGAVPTAQELSLEEREALYDRFHNAAALVRGGEVQPRWFEDGSSFSFRDGRQSLLFDAATGELREATLADRRREVRPEVSVRGQRAYAPGGKRSFRLAKEGPEVEGEGLDAPLLLDCDLPEFVTITPDPGAWSPDGNRLFIVRTDARQVHRLPLVDFTQAEETVRFVAYPKAGGSFGHQEILLFAVPSGEKTVVDPLFDEEQYLFPVGWRDEGRELLYLRMTRDAKRLDLMAADATTGTSHVILTDEAETFIGGLDFLIGGYRDYFAPVEGTDSFLWLSERDGWRHIYHYDYDGKLLGRVTAGEYPVQKVIATDVERDRVYFLAHGEARLYDTHLYRAPLSGVTEANARPVCLTEGEGEHDVVLSPSKLFLVDQHSSLERPPAAELRTVEGEHVALLTAADTTKLDELGWLPPEEFTATAADGVTPLRGVLYKPVDFDPARRYPVIDFIYSGPFITVVPNDFRQRSHLAARAQAMAQMGFVTFIVDPRGTTGRSKAFQDASYGRIGEIEIPDHVATLHQLAATRPFMDLDRIGVYGASWGGYFALRAMLTAPEVFRVGVSMAPGDLTESVPINEPYMDLPSRNPTGYAAGANPPLARNLTGKLLLIHGTSDVNAPFSTSMRMASALIDAGKPFDLLVIPGGTHYFEGNHGNYAVERLRRYFVEHLAPR